MRSNLRDPLERPLFVVYAVLNVTILAAALLVAVEGADWLIAHPRLAKYSKQLHAIATLIILGPLSLTFLRNTRHAEIRGNSLVVSPDQVPELHQILVSQCQRLGIEKPPDLYFSDRAIKGPSYSDTAWGKRDHIVLGTTFMQPDLTQMLPVFAFLIGRELGRLRLGHTHWGSELLLSCTNRIPYAKNPLPRVFTYSEDRWGAFLAPDALPALVAMAAGRRMFPKANIPEYLAQVKNNQGLWITLSEFFAETPAIAGRIQALEEAGLLHIE